MKKSLMIAVLMFMFLSMIGTLNISAATTDIYTIKGDPTMYWAASWHEGSGSYQNFYLHHWLNRNVYQSGGTAGLASGAIGAFKNMPDGRHSVIVNPTGTDLHHIMVEDRENWVYWDIGVAKLAKIMEDFGVELKKQGGKLDWIVGDMEAGFSCYHIELDQTTSPWHADPPDEVLPRYDAIVKDPRWETDIKPILTDMGFVWPKDPNMNPLYYVCYRSNFPPDGSENNYKIFNRFSSVIKRVNLNKCIWEPIKKSFPNVKYADYQYNEIDNKWRHLNASGEKDYLAPNAKNIKPYPNSGSHAAPNIYGALGMRLLRTNPPPAYPWDVYAHTRMNGLRHTIIRLFTSYLTPGDLGAVTPVVPYVGYYTFQEGDATRIDNNDYFVEAIYHASTVVTGTDPMFYWNPSYPPTMPAIDADNQIFQDTLAEVSEMMGFADRKPLIGPQTTTAEIDARWVHRYFLSGMYAGGRNVYRFTVDDSVPGITSLKDVIVSKSPVKIQVANEIIEFPKGYKIVTPTAPVAANVGMWIVGPKDTFPKEYNDPNKKAAPCPDNQPADMKGVPATYFIPTEYKAAKENPNRFDTYAGQEIVTPLIDIKDTTYEMYIKQMYRRGYVKGVDETHFLPDNPLTRVELLTILLRAAGIKEDVYKGGFSDVQSTDWFAGVVQASVNKGISKGIGGGLFDPLSNVTREQIAVFLAQAYKDAGKKIETIKDGTYTDKDAISEWATQAVNECHTIGITDAIWGSETFNPKAKVTRGEAAALVLNMIRAIRGLVVASPTDPGTIEI